MKRKIVKICLFLCLIAVGVQADAQSWSNAKVTVDTAADDHHHLDDRKGVFGRTFSFYQWLFSSQDGNRCSFYPSCSAFAVSSVREHKIVGILAAFDRLVRCHTFHPEQYRYHYESRRQYDPVD